jgi:hypothetical protein
LSSRSITSDIRREKNKMKIIKVICLLLCICYFNCFRSGAQAVKREKKGIGYGGSIIYNFHATSLGADLRMKIPLVNKLSIVPQLSYFPAFNDYHEFYGGAALHLEIARIGTYNLYIHGAGFYNRWINAADYSQDEGDEINFAYEAGGGLVRSFGCIRPFIEDGYDFRWRENSLRIGIYFYPGSCQSKEKCPAYD